MAYPTQVWNEDAWQQFVSPEWDEILSPQNPIEEEQRVQPELPAPMIEGIKKTVRVACHVPGCGKDYSKKCDLKRHIEKHHGTEELLARPDLKDKYAEQKEFPCPHSGCKSSCARSYDLLRHLRTMHKNEPPPQKPKVFICVDCQKELSRTDSLKRHVHEVHQNKSKKH